MFLDVEWLLPANVKKMDINKNAHNITNRTIENGRDILIFNSFIALLKKNSMFDFVRFPNGLKIIYIFLPWVVNVLATMIVVYSLILSTIATIHSSL